MISERAKLILNKVLRKLLLLLLFPYLIFPSFAFIPVAYGASGAPRIISYQGRLLDSSGNLLGGSSGTTYYFKFSIWDNATVGSGTRLWPASAPTSVGITVTSGVFNVNIGDTRNGYPDLLNYNFNTNQDIYLQVEASSDNSTFETLSPRQRIAASSFSILSEAVSGTSTPSSFGTTSPIGLSVVTIEATTTDAIGLSVRAASGQTANILQIQDARGINQIFVDSDFKFGIGTSTIGTKLEVAGGGVFKGTLYTEATSTASSIIATSTLGVGTSTPGTNTQLSVVGNVYFGGGLAVGRSATTTPGHVGATLLHSDTQIVARGLLSCDTIDTDANGVFKCGSDASGATNTDLQDAYNTSADDAQITTTDTKDIIFDIEDTATDANVAITIEDPSGGQFLIQNRNSSEAATTTVFTVNRDGSVGIAGTTTPGAGLAVGSGTTTILGLDVYAWGQLNIPNLVATSTSLTSLIQGSLGIASSSLGGNKLEVGGFGVVKGNFNIEATSTLSSLNATNTISVASSSPGSGINLAVLGHTVLGGNLTVTGAADFQGDINFGTTGTTTFQGGLSAAGLASSQGVTISGGDLLFSGSGKVTVTGSATSTLPNLNVSTLLGAAAINTTGPVSVGGRLEVTGSASSSFSGGLAIGSTGGLSSASGLTITGGNIQTSGRIKVTDTATSTFSGGIDLVDLKAVSLHVTGGNTFDRALEVTESATSSFVGGILVASTGGLTSASGLTITGGNIQTSGRITSTDTATSSFSGGLAVSTVGGLSSAAGLTLTGGDIQSSGKFTITSTATSSISGSLDITGTGGLQTARIYNSGAALNVGSSLQNLSLAGAQIIGTAPTILFGTTTAPLDSADAITFEATSTASNVLTLRGFGSLNKYAGNLFQIQDSVAQNLIVANNVGALSILASSSPSVGFAVGATSTIIGGQTTIYGTTTVAALSATSTLGIASSSPGSGVNLAVTGHTVLGGNVSVVGNLDVQSTATST